MRGVHGPELHAGPGHRGLPCAHWRPFGAWSFPNCIYHTNKGWEMPNNCVIGSIYGSILINTFNYRCNKLAYIHNNALQETRWGRWLFWGILRLSSGYGGLLVWEYTHGWAEAEADREASYKIIIKKKLKKKRWNGPWFSILMTITPLLSKNMAREGRPAEGRFNLSGFKKSLPLV